MEYLYQNGEKETFSPYSFLKMPIYLGFVKLHFPIMQMYVYAISEPNSYGIKRIR